MNYDPISTFYKFYINKSRPVKMACVKSRCKCGKGRSDLGEENTWEIGLARTMREIWIERYGGGGFKGGSFTIFRNIVNF
jgi:hypothetical protein